MQLYINKTEVFYGGKSRIIKELFDSIPDILFYKNYHYGSNYNMREHLPNVMRHIINTIFQRSYINIFSSKVVDWYLSKLGILCLFNELIFQKKENGQLLTISSNVIKELALVYILDPDCDHIEESIIKEDILEYVNSLKKIHPRKVWKAIEKVLSGNITSLVRGNHSPFELEHIFSNNRIQYIISKNCNQFANIMTLCGKSDMLKYTKYYMKFRDSVEECWINIIDGKRYVKFSDTFNDQMFLTLQEHDFIGVDCMDYEWFCLGEEDGLGKYGLSCLDNSAHKAYIIEFMCNMGLDEYTMLEIKTFTGISYISNDIILAQFGEYLNAHYRMYAPLPLEKRTECPITNKILQKQFFVLATLDITTAESIMSQKIIQRILFCSYYQYDFFISIFHVLVKKNRFDILILIIKKLANREWWKSKCAYKWVRAFFKNGLIDENASNYDYDEIHFNYSYNDVCVLTTLIESEHISDDELIYMHDSLLNYGGIGLEMDAVELQSYDYDYHNGDYYRALTDISKYIIANRRKYAAYLACMGITEFSYTTPLLRQDTSIYKFIYDGSLPAFFTKDIYLLSSFEMNIIYRQEYNSIFTIYTMIYNKIIVNINFSNVFYSQELFIMVISYLLDEHYYAAFMKNFIHL